MKGRDLPRAPTITDMAAGDEEEKREVVEQYKKKIIEHRETESR